MSQERKPELILDSSVYPDVKAIFRRQRRRERLNRFFVAQWKAFLQVFKTDRDPI
ncbi:hypothetical protein ACUH97_00565 [Dermabacteraceae bacterium P13088]